MTEKILRGKIQSAVEQVRSENPMAPSITNTVTQDFVANAQLAVGGSAAMIYLPDEGETMAQIAPAVYLNIGTLQPFYAETIPRTLRALKKFSTPYVLDPVAIGIGVLRTELFSQMKNFPPAVIRGNASEIIALAKLWDLTESAKGKTRGVDSTDSVGAAKLSAVALAKFTGGAVAISGAEDLVTDGKVLVYSSGGSAMLSKITGGGCALGGVMATYLSVTDSLTAALTGTAIFNCAASTAEKFSDAPASFKVKFLDELYKVSAAAVAENPLRLEAAE
ncbi:MAG: hydroxyethylthiazole kinase [Selenomonadaceae bacterium]|nr:hydroxyethylthiazole kinase [Selenomonadaceae bacterium]